MGDSNFSFDYLITTIGCQYGMYMTNKKMPSSALECLWYPTFLEDEINNTKGASEWSAIDERFIMGRFAHFVAEKEVLENLAQKRGCVAVIGAGLVGIEWAAEIKH